MKLKHRPEDFCVEELTSVVPAEGPFALYRLTKRGLGTPEAVAAMVRRWHLPPGSVAYGGLKDRHAVTTQWLTIHGGPRRALRQTNLALQYVGQTTAAFGSADITANRFRIVLRELSEAEAAAATGALAALAVDGVPNYFDRQRFGSVGRSGEFMARAWCARDYERALWLALTDPNSHDRGREKTAKAALDRGWGDWASCCAAVGRTPAAAAVAHLAAHPGDFRAALGRLPQSERRMHLAAFQSFLWNRLLGAFLRQQCRGEQLRDAGVAGHTLPFHHALDPQQREAILGQKLPLPSARIQHDEGPVQALLARVLGAMNLTAADLEIETPRDSFFSRGNRAAAFLPSGLEHELGADEIYASRQKLTLQFDLPRGCYATMLIACTT